MGKTDNAVKRNILRANQFVSSMCISPSMECECMQQPGIHPRLVSHTIDIGMVLSLLLSFRPESFIFAIGYIPKNFRFIFIFPLSGGKIHRETSMHK
jgi:hypothetical protein